MWPTYCAFNWSVRTSSSFLCGSLPFSVNRKLLEEVGKDIIINGTPGPINRGVESPTIIADSGQTSFWQQVENRVATRMAALYLLAGKKVIR